MADEKVKVSSLPGAVSVNNEDALYLVQGGVSKQLPFSVVRELMSSGDVQTGTFNNSNLTGGIWTLEHAKNTPNVLLFIFNQAGFIQNGVQWRKQVADPNNAVEADFGGEISETYSYVLVYWVQGSTTGGYTANSPIGTDVNGDLIAFTSENFRSLIDVYSKAEVDTKVQNPVNTEGFVINTVGSGMAVYSYTLRKYGNVVNFNARFWSEFDSGTPGSYTRLCNIPGDIAPYPGIYGPLSPENGSLSETGSITVSADGKIYISVGKADKIWLCNVTWILNPVG